jgi:hypothetical protein
MFAVSPQNTERYAAIGCVSLGLVISVLLAPKNSLFLPNFAFFWASQLGVLAVTWLLKSRVAVVAGVAIAMAIYLAAFGAWAFTRVQPDSMAWLGYLSSLPGAVVGTCVAEASLGYRPHLRPLLVGSLTAGIVLVGVICNQVAVCSTVMYCLGK